MKKSGDKSLVRGNWRLKKLRICTGLHHSCRLEPILEVYLWSGRVFDVFVEVLEGDGD